MGLLERHGEVRTMVVPNVKRKSLRREINTHVDGGSMVYTDALKSYNDLNYDYMHNVINHAEKYVESNVHTNGIENFWSLLKRTIGGTYFMTVENQGRVVYGNKIKEYYGWEGATINGSLRSSTAQIELPFPTPFRSFQPKAVHDRMAREFAEQRAWSNAQTLIHEAFHLAGYTDSELMRAAAAIAGTNHPDLSGLTPNDRTRAASIYWDDELEAACPPVR